MAPARALPPPPPLNAQAETPRLFPDVPRPTGLTLPHEPEALSPPEPGPGVASGPGRAQGPDDAVLEMLRGIVVAPAGTPPRRPADRAGGPVIGLSDLGLDDRARTELTQVLAPYLGHAAGFATFARIEATIARWYRGHGRAFVAVSIPPQRIERGIVAIRVMEYRIGTITVSGNRWIADWEIRARSGLRPGDTLSLQGLQTDLAWMNGNPFATVDTIFRPGAVPGTTDLDLDVADRLPVYVFAGYNNQADPTVGRLNWNAGASWGDAFGLGQTLSYQLTRSDTGRATTHLGSWSVPLLGWRDQILLYGVYSRTAPVAAPPYRNLGVSGQASIRYEHTLGHLALGSGFGIDGLIRLGFDWKTTRSLQYIGPRPIVRATADTDQFVFLYQGSVQDPWGKTDFRSFAAYGPGGLTAHDTRRAYLAIVPRSKPDYVYERLSLTRGVSIGAGFSSSTTLTGQAATHNLLYGEQLEAGGIGTVRGYFVNSALGSAGALASEELRAPALSVLKILGVGAGFTDTDRVGAFWDWGETTQKHTAPGFGNQTGLASTGIDLTSTVNRIATLTFDMGARLRRAPGSGKHGEFCDFSVVVGL